MSNGCFAHSSIKAAALNAPSSFSAQNAIYSGIAFALPVFIFKCLFCIRLMALSRIIIMPKAL